MSKNNFPHQFPPQEKYQQVLKLKSQKLLTRARDAMTRAP